MPFDDLKVMLLKLNIVQSSVFQVEVDFVGVRLKIYSYVHSVYDS